MQTKLKRNNLIQSIILFIILILFAIYIFYSIYVSAKREMIIECIDKNKLSNIEIEIPKETLDKIYENPQKEEYVSVNVKINGKEYRNCGLRTKGSISYEILGKTSNPNKHGYRLELDYFIEDQTYDDVSKFYLNNGLLDKTYIKEMVCFDLYEKVNVKVPKRCLCDLKINGTSEGVYTLVEVAAEEFIEREFNTQDGIIYKAKVSSEENSDDNALTYVDDNFESYYEVMDAEKFGKTFEKEDMERLIETYKAISTNENIEEYVDIESVLNYFVICFFVNNDDSYVSASSRNYYIYQENDKITLLPYDLNLYFRTRSAVNNAILYFDTYNNNPENKPLIYNILTDEIYQQQYKDKMKTLIREIEEEDFINQRIDVYANLIDEVAKEKNNFYSYEEYIKAVDALKRVFEKRKDSVKKQLEINKNYSNVEYVEEIGDDLYLLNGVYKK